MELSVFFWDCECNIRYIHPNSHEKCDICGAVRDDMPDSRINEMSPHHIVFHAGDEVKVGEGPQAVPAMVYDGYPTVSRVLLRNPWLPRPFKVEQHIIGQVKVAGVFVSTWGIE